MKIKIDKMLREGRYFVYVEVGDFSPEEEDKMRKFGVPNIDLSPRSTWYKNKIVSSLPLNEIKTIFIFNNSIAANSFETTIKSKIEAAVKLLRIRRDNFSASKEYEI